MSRYRSRSAQHPRWLRYGMAVAAVAAALGLRLLLGDLLQATIFALFLVAVAVVAWWAGLGPALVATGLSILAAEYFLLDPPGAIELHRPTDLLALLTFGFIAVLVSWASTTQREAKQALAVRGRELERVAAELEARRAEAERARDHSGFLAEVSGVLTASLDYEESLQELARFLVKRMADYSVTYMVEEDETIRRVGVAHADPQREELVHRLLDLQPPTVADPHGAGAVIRTGERVLAREIDDALLERSTQSREHLEVIRELAPISSIIVPLRARGRIVGAIAFATTSNSGRRYDEKDLHAAEELARHAALAVDNARLLGLARKELGQRRRTERRLRRREVELRALVEHAPDVIARFDREYRYVYVNPAVEEATGVAPDRLLGRSNREMEVDPELVSRWERSLGHVFSSGRPSSLEFRLPTAKGPRWFHARLVPESDTSGDLVTVLCIARDVTDRKRAEVRRELLLQAGRLFTSSLDVRRTVETVAQVVVETVADVCLVDLVDLDGESLERVEAVAKDPGVEARMRELQERFPIDRRGAEHPVGRVLRTGEAVLATRVPEELLERLAVGPEHLRLLRELGIRSYMVVPLSARGRTVGVISVATLRDGPRYGADDLELLKELAIQAGLALENARLYEQLRRSLTLREEVLAVVAHDLRDPLGTIASATAVLEEGPDAEERERLIGVLRRQLDRAERLIHDLLDVSRLEAGRLSMEPERVPLARVVEEACDAARLRAGDRAVRFRRDVDEEATAVVDRSRILQVLSNLLDNAVKATPEGGEVAVEVREDEGGVRVAVRDEGPGIPESEIPRLFERFWQGRSRSDGSAGLGLTIVRGIVEEHGGRVWVESRKEEGSTFFFSLPGQPAMADEVSES